MDHREFGHAEPFLRLLVAGVCAWEVVAITTGRVPTVSRVSRRWPVFGDVVLDVLGIHFTARAVEKVSDFPTVVLSDAGS